MPTLCVGVFVYGLPEPFFSWWKNRQRRRPKPHLRPDLRRPLPRLFHHPPPRL